MLILHTSDWHLGRSFHGTGMLQSQREVLDQMVATVRERGVDLVLVAGDVYDRALPAADAVELLDAALADLVSAGARVVLTSGNHDSAIRLGFGGHLMGAAGVHVRTRMDGLNLPVVLPDPEGGTVAVYGIPYLEPRHAGQVWDVEPNHPAVTAEAVRRIREDAAERFGAQGDALGEPDEGPGGGTAAGTAAATAAGADTAIIVMAHLFAAGGAGSDSERDIGAERPAETEAGEPLVGTLGQVPATVFEGVDYAALGHLHGRQRLAETVRYSGSPLPYSFSEADHTKGGWLVRTASGRVTDVEPVDFSAGRRLAVLRGRIQDLLEGAEYAWAEDRWCQITVTDQVRPPQAYRRLKERYEGLLNFILDPEGVTATAPSTYAARLAAATTDLQVCTGFVEHVRQRPATASEAELLDTALDESRSRTEQGEGSAA
ncbi:MAG: exonuclease SbcCD subunit D [Citricoccus sp.]